MKKLLYSLLIIIVSLLFIFGSCSDQPATSDSGVTKATVRVQTDGDGNTVEQKNYMKRVTRDNDLGAVKHLYIISSYSGDVLEYSTVKGKVTSGGKRLTPKSVNDGTNTGGYTDNTVSIDGTVHPTTEVMDEYGTYGDSGNYLYWFDAQDNYHPYYPSGGTFLHISDRPLRIMKANFSVEMTTALELKK